MTSKSIPARTPSRSLEDYFKHFSEGRIQHFDHDRSYDYSDKSFELVIEHVDLKTKKVTQQRVVVFVDSIQDMINELYAAKAKYDSEAQWSRSC